MHPDLEIRQSVLAGTVDITNASIVTGGVRVGSLPVVLRGPQKEIVTNALLDMGSEVMLISKKLARTLELDGDRCTLNIRAVNGAQITSSDRVHFDLVSLDKDLCYGRERLLDGQAILSEVR